VIDVPCTGISIPALDVELVPALGLRADVRRIPITESGCAAGALALGLAGSFARTGQTVLVIAVELCSLTLCREDRSRTNLVASLLFGDGAAAAIVAPEASPRAGPRLCAVGSHLFADSAGLMGFDVGAHGLRIVLQRELAEHLAAHLRGAIEGFLEQHGRSLDDIGLHLVHPGGRRILEAYTALFGLPESALEHSRAALRRHGNLSSVSILTVLESALDARARPGPGREALVLGIGPGLSAELSLWSFDD
jgi:alkylresorcinol/alkylpyrone synthase